MTKKIVNAAALSRKDFDAFLSHSKANKVSKARYERAWKREHEKKIPNEKNASVRSKVIVQKQERQEPSKEATKRFGTLQERKAAHDKAVIEARESAKGIKYPIKTSRLDVSYNEAKKDFDKYSTKTQKRYWSAWHKRIEDQKPQRDKEHPSYRIVVGYKVKIDGEYMRDDHNNIVVFHYSAIRNKKRLNKAELAGVMEEIQVTTNAKVTDIIPETAYDNWTGKKV